MILSDQDIEKALYNGLEITPYNPEYLNPASVDVTLCEAVKGQRKDTVFADTRSIKDEAYYNSKIDTLGTIVYPGDFLLMSTVEKFKIPSNLVAILSGKSSLARLGLCIHSTAGFIDPGFEGQITLEVSNVGEKAIVLYAGMRIGQVSFTCLTSPARRPYGSEGLGSHYQHQEGPQESLYEGSGQPKKEEDYNC